jgi:hydrogenase nickel incorporation protein HypB
MCATCGCGLDDDHGDDHDHGHGHDHGHDHGPHDHDHEGHAVPHIHARHARAHTLSVEKDVLAKNQLLAERNRGWLDGRGILALNLMSSPGAGKTTLLEKTVARVGAELAISVIEGDQATLRDAARIQAAGAKALQINTGAGCHLDAQMLADALPQLDPAPRSLLIIENVGNLVCPALFDLGESQKVVLVSVTEGDDKPLKYPHMFRAADVLVLNKIDLLPYVAFDAGRFLEDVARVNPRARTFQLSATRGDGLDAWCAWLAEAARQRRG